MRNNIILGVILSVCITIFVSVTHLSSVEGGHDVDIVAFATFSTLILMWFAHLLLMYSNRYMKIISNIWLRSIISVVLVLFVVGALLEGLFIINDMPYIGNCETPLEIRQHRWLISKLFMWSMISQWILFSQKTIEEKNHALLDASMSRQLALEAKLSSLKEQLSPHFMFNSLNTLSSMTEDCSVHNFVGKLAEIYRYLLTTKDKSEVSLKEELEFTNAYWYIQKERFEDSIDLKIDLREDILKIDLPPMTIQTLVENAVKHNKATEYSPLVINIREEDGKIVISNKIQEKQKIVESTGIGLQNLSQRYRLLYARDIEVIVNDNFIVKLPIVEKS